MGLLVSTSGKRVLVIDSDAHAPGQLDMLDYGCERAEAAGIPAERIVNTWTREKLRSWSGGGTR